MFSFRLKFIKVPIDKSEIKLISKSNFLLP